MRTRNAPLKAFAMKDEKTKLKDLRPNDKNVDLDKGENMPVKRSGFGPRANTNLGNMMTRQPEDKAE